MMALLISKALAIVSRRLPCTTVSRIQRRTLPICTVQTNVSRTDLNPDTPKKLSKLIADTLNKPEKLPASYDHVQFRACLAAQMAGVPLAGTNAVMVSVHTDTTICKGSDTSSTYALVQIWAVGVFDEEKNAGHAKTFYDFLPKTFGIPAERIYVVLHPVQPHDVAHKMYQPTSNK